MELHTEALQIVDSRCPLRMPAEQADAGQPEAPGGGRQCMKMIGVGTAKAEKTRRASYPCSVEVMRKLEPLISGQLRINQIQAQYGEPDVRLPEPGQIDGLQRRRSQVQREELG